MKRIIFSLALAAVLFSSCTKEENPVSNTTPSETDAKTYNTFICGVDEVRTTLEGNQAVWADGDKIRINGSTFEYTGIDTETGRGIFSLSEGDPVSAPFDAFYPASMVGSWSENAGFTFTLAENPATCVANNFSFCPMYAHLDDPTTAEKPWLNFRNITSMLKIGGVGAVTGTVTLKVTSSKPISGTASVSASGTDFSELDKTSVSATFTNQPGSSVDTVYVVVPAVTGAVFDIAVLTDTDVWTKHVASATLPVNQMGKISMFGTPAKNIHHGVKLASDSNLYWADMNIDAKSPEEAGWYIAWGAPEIAYKGLANNTFSFRTRDEGRPESYGGDDWGWTPGFNSACAPYYSGSQKKYIKYCKSDGIKVLEPNDDIVARNWGLGWRTPTLEQFRDLAAQCVWIVSKSGSNILGHYIYKVKDSSHKGYIKNGNGSNNRWIETMWHNSGFGSDVSNQYNSAADICIYLPFYQPGSGTSVLTSVTYSAYWTSSIFDNSEEACCAYINATYAAIGCDRITNPTRYYGCLVRPVFVVE